jgi:hypothetical protein
MVSNAIVQVNVTQTVAPIPETLQQTGAIVSVGATILSPGTSSVITQPADLVAILLGAQTLASITYSSGSGIATATAAANHNIPVGDEVELTIAGALPAAYNGTFLCTSTGVETFTYYPLSNPGGSASTAGGYSPEDVAELTAQVTTFFAQSGPGVAVYVLEFGIQDPNDAVTALSNYLVQNPNTEYEPGDSGFYYVYLLPRTFDGVPNLLSLLPTYDGDNAQTYFVITTTLSTYQLYSDLWKDAITLIETPAMGQYAQNLVTNIVQNEQQVSTVAIATAQSGAGSYAPANVLTATGGTGTEPTFTVVTTKVVSATVNAGGTGGTNGTQTVTGTTGTGTKFQASVTIAGGAITAVLSISVAGSYTVNPSVLTAEPVTGGGLTGATLAVIMGVATVSITTVGNLSVVPPNPITTTVSPNVGTGCLLTVIWTYGGTATATTTNPHLIAVGEWFQLSGFTPTTWNGWYVALAGTTGSTIVFPASDALLPVSIYGFVVQNIAKSNGVGTTEFQAATVFFDILSRNPGPGNRQTSFAFDYCDGVTPWPKQGLSALQLTLKEAAVNIIKTGAEGGISNAALYWGTTQDGRQIGYWYSVDWININGHVDVANTVINGSNDPINPLYYTQTGINTLQDTLAATVSRGVTAGLAFQGPVVKTSLDATTLSNNIDSGAYNGQLVVNAIPFLTYLSANPDDYRTGTYNGLQVLYVTQNGFLSILININVTDFVVQPGT